MGWVKMQEEGGDVKKNGTVHQLYIKTSTLLCTVYTIQDTVFVYLVTVIGSILMFYWLYTVKFLNTARPVEINITPVGIVYDKKNLSCLYIFSLLYKSVKFCADLLIRQLSASERLSFVGAGKIGNKHVGTSRYLGFKNGNPLARSNPAALYRDYTPNPWY